MIKTYHEAPKSMFEDVQRLTYGDYALVHLLEQDEEYCKAFLEKGRHVILDNSVFELETAFDADKFATWVEKLKPEYYIVPDVLEDGPATVASFMSFIKRYKNLPGMRIGVVQGKSYQEAVECYKAIAPYCDKIAISFDFSWWKDMYPVGADSRTPTKWHAFVRGRIWTLCQMLEDGVIDKSLPHHLLGVALPQEMKFYSAMMNDLTESRGWRWIDSIDTSNPVVHGIKGIPYSSTGLEDKESQKLHELINYEPSMGERNLIMNNIKMFRRFCNE